MATEGVERLQMGENAEQVIAMAKAAGAKVSSTDNSLGIQSADDYAANAGKNKKSTRKELDLNAFKVGVFDDDDDVFGEDEKSEAEKKAEVLEDSMANKLGDDLRSAANKLCVEQMPKQCVDSTSMLQLAYTQKIKSDCNAYENSLKQQKIASNQKLAAAEKALREAALESFEKENKYELGPCITEFTKCIQKDAGCGEDYTGCTTLSAKDNVRNKTGQQTVIPGTTVKISVSTLEAITAKKSMCEHITKQCVKANQNDAVWTAFLKNVAPALKSAEELAEEKLRLECIPNISECFQKACAQKFDPKAKEANYDSCLSDPSIVKDLCKVKLEPCLEATGGSYANAESSSLWNGVLAALGAMRVDACTSEVKACLESDDVCGKDYGRCVGLDTESIGEMCPTDKLTACMAKNENNESTVRAYVARVAQGIALGIDSNMLTVCQKAADDAMTKVCGATDSCESLTFDGRIFADNLNVQVCRKGAEGVYECANTADGFDAKYVLNGEVVPNITGMFDLATITFDTENGFGVDTGLASYTEKTSNGRYYTGDKWADSVAKQLNAAINAKWNTIKSDPTVTYCMEGRQVQGFDSKKFGKKNDKESIRFPNLLDNKRDVMIYALYKSMSSAYSDALDGLQEKREAAQKTIDDRLARIDGAGESAQDRLNESACQSGYARPDPNWNGDRNKRRARAYIRQLVDVNASYNADTNVCTAETMQYTCTKYLSPSCRIFDNGTKTKTKTIQMHKYNREDALGSNGYTAKPKNPDEF